MPARNGKAKTKKKTMLVSEQVRNLGGVVA